MYPSGHFHPGATSSTTTLVHAGPLTTQLESTTADGWAIRWDIFAQHATATVLAAPANYWFLYEGTPGGSLDGSTDTITRSGGQTTALSSGWVEDLADPEWVYVTDDATQRSLYLAAHQGDDAVDSHRVMNGQMTVLGLGRQRQVPFVRCRPVIVRGTCRAG